MLRRLSLVIVLATLLASCGQAAAPSAQPAATAAQGGDVSPQFAFSEAVVGRTGAGLECAAQSGPDFLRFSLRAAGEPAAVHERVADGLRRLLPQAAVSAKTLRR